MSADIWQNLSDEASQLLDMRIFQERTSITGNCESPIEEAFMVACFVQDMIYGYSSLRLGIPSSEANEANRRSPARFIEPQWEVAGYRADFLIGYSGAGTNQQTSIIVECDGHQWHEKTAEQAQRDKERDRVLHEHVAKVIRFTGSEIFRSPLGCAQQALHLLDKCFMAWAGGAK